jgi:hypothetical protein
MLESAEETSAMASGVADSGVLVVVDAGVDDDAGSPALADAGVPPPPPPPPPVFGTGDDDAGSQFLTPGTFENLIFATGLGAYRADTAEDGERHGPGGTFADLDNDGFPDLVLCTGPNVPHALYRNVAADDGGRQFVHVPLEDDLGGGVGAVAADYDNDGDLDVFIGNYGTADRLYRNRFVEDGVLSLEDVTAATDPTPDDPDDEQAGVGTPRWNGQQLLQTMTAAWADVNRDGFPDLYVGTHNGSRDNPDVGDLPGQRNTLLLNGGDGTFTDVTDWANVGGWQSELGEHESSEQVFSSTNAVLFFDMNGDPWPDLLVSNKTWTLREVEAFYLNRGTDAEGNWLGFSFVSYDFPADGERVASLAMGVAAADHDNDGDIDLYFTDVSAPGLLEPDGMESGLPVYHRDRGMDPGYSWGAIWEDFDHDGWLDLHVSTNSGVRDQVYRSSGISRSTAARDWGLDQRRNARGTMAADFDRDGWLDLFVVNLSGTSSLYRNRIVEEIDPSERHWIALKLIGDPSLPGEYRSSRDALGARVFVTARVAPGEVVTMRRDVQSGGSNAASTSSLWLELGTGEATSVDVTVQWPSGRMSTLMDVPADGYRVIVETE